MVDDLLPEFVCGDSLEATSQDCCFEELAQVELFTSDLRYLKVFHAEIFLELD